MQGLSGSGMDQIDGVADGTEQDYDGEERRSVPGIVDRRKHPRYAVDAWAEVLVKDATMLFRGRVLDISLAGCFVATEARLRLAQGTAVDMVFRVGDSVMRCEATIRMTRPAGAGFLFGTMDERTRMTLDSLIRRLEDGQ
jgi:hypothetical protein